jgi:SAM-dependent methyltransferase
LVTAAALRRILDGLRAAPARPAVPIAPEPGAWDLLGVLRSRMTVGGRVLQVGLRDTALVRALGGSKNRAVGAPDAIDPLERDDAAVAAVDLAVMSSGRLAFRAQAFDLVIAVDALAGAEEVERVLKPAGFFVSEQHGERAYQNIFDAFGWGSYGAWQRQRCRELRLPSPLAEDIGAEFGSWAFEYDLFSEYEAKAYLPDLEALVALIETGPFPERLDPERHRRAVNHLIEAPSTPRGIETTLHRELISVERI